MTSERVQRRIDRLLDQAEEAADRRDWPQVAESVQMVLGVDPENADALAFQAMLENAGVGGGNATPPAVDHSVGVDSDPPSGGPLPAPTTFTLEETPTSFANDRYQVSRFLGEGGKKRVYLAHDTLLDREVAFALIKTEGFDQISKERISREAQAMGRLGVHPNIVAVLDLGRDVDGSPYMVTEFMSGGDVEGLLSVAQSSLPEGEGEREGEDPFADHTVGAYGDTPSGGASPAPTTNNALSLDRTIEIGKAVCEGLEFAHGRGIIHRDLKPGNVWLAEDGAAKIGDFGLAVMTDRSRLTREGMMVGTVSYMPPEQATGGDITPRADLYSLGAMLYEMATGRPPFLGDDEIAIIGQHINTPPVAPTWHNDDCPRPLEALVMRLLSKDPAERPDSAQDVFNALDAIDLTARGETVEQDQTSLESLAGGVFVGRQAEMDQLKAALEDVLGGRGRLIALMGEPGIGKTRTSEELATYAGLRGAQVLWGRCYETGGQPPYWPWVQAIRSYVRETEPEELRRQMGSSASVVAEIVTDVNDRLPGIQAPIKLDDPDSARFRLFDSITSFLNSASQSQPLVIVLDDLHWSDRPSLAYLEFMAREISQSRVMLICTYRDMELNRRHPLTVTLGDLARERLYERVLLRGLSENDIARFIEIAAGFSAPPELSATVYRHTEGNPLFVTEVVRELVQSGELAEHRSEGESTWSVRIPEGVREVIGRRLDRLSERANEMLTTAAVVGRDFRLDALTALAEDTTESQLLDVLDEALDARIIEELSDEVGHYQFTHALMQETLTGELSLTRRVRLHASIAEALERLYGNEAYEHSAELAHHFAEAEAVSGTERLIRYSVAAGEQALEATAPDAATTHFEIALTAAGDGEIDALLARILLGLGRASIAVAVARPQIHASFEILLKAFDFYSSEGDPAVGAEIAAYPVGQQGSAVGMADLMEQGLNLAEPDSVVAGKILAARGSSLYWERDDLDGAEAALERAIEIGKSTGEIGIEVSALLGKANLQLGQYTRIGNLECLAAADTALGLIGTNSDAVSEARANTYAAIAAVRLGHLEQALVYATAGSEGGAKTRDGYSRFFNQLSRAQAYFASGRWEQAIETVAQIAFIQLEGTPRQLELAVRFQQGLEAHPEAIIEFLNATHDTRPGLVANCSLVAAEFHYIKPNDTVDAATQNAIQRVEAYETAIYGDTLRPILNAAAIILAATRGNVEESRRRYELLKPYCGTMMYSVFADRILGLSAWTAGDTAAADGHFRDALVFGRENGCLKDLAWTCSDYAEMLLERAEGASSASGIGDREKAIELQNEALAITQELGMRPLTERILTRREILKA